MPVYEGASWNTGGAVTTVTWSFAAFNFDLTSQFSGYKTFDTQIADTYKATIRAAFSSWEAIANIDFVEVTDTSSVDIRLGNRFIDGTSSGSSVLAETLYWFRSSQLDAAEIYFDGDAYTGGSLFEIAEHEIGHAIGLGHSSSPSNVMYFQTNTANKAGTFTADDILGVQTLYGAKQSIFTGSSSSDVFTSTSINERFDGAGGVDTLVLHGTRSQYSVTGSLSGLTVTDSVAGRDGSDTTVSVEQLKFTDVTLIFDLTSLQDRLVYLLYQAAYARMPDQSGFRFWAGVADANGTSARSLADNFMAAPEFSAKYGNPTNSGFVNAMYGNVLGRTPDSAGLSFWTQQLNNGLARDDLLVNFATSVENATLTASHLSNGFWVA